jgi:hypothetical protein
MPRPPTYRARFAAAPDCNPHRGGTRRPQRKIPRCSTRPRRRRRQRGPLPPRRAPMRSALTPSRPPRRRGGAERSGLPAVADGTRPWSFRRGRRRPPRQSSPGLRRQMRGASGHARSTLACSCGGRGLPVACARCGCAVRGRRRLESGDGEEISEVRVYSVVVIVCLWAWASMFIWASFSLFMHIHVYSGTHRVSGAGMLRTFQAPLHPTGITFDLLRSPRGLKISQLHPLMEEFPIGDRGPITIPNWED